MNFHYNTAGRLIARELRKRTRERNITEAEAAESIIADVEALEKPEDAEGLIFRAIIELSNTQEFANDMDGALRFLKRCVKKNVHLDEIQWS